ncbi:MAG TPA: bifunctional folylpolyglutamate synthase/dihydrofolate synthase [Candidatus Eisenbergiella merdipullorum]|uniref:tetrahydrofolate synthase n=1 Tax=Candidatus Eisenbergiella merdipullorum TaxID=2838553 RepID=A0A9D2I5R8_9FIRM|nr:bifunctional folylpolyglutamate synthase/dihydrofolate synthase [Candidatus Eisenbergiella merdipullorum]
MRFSYEQAVDYILGVPRFTKKNVLEDTNDFYDFLGRPGERACIVHVAGTNGKGSVCAYINSVLEKAHISTGMFTSPHLVDIRERFRLNGEMISREAFASCMNLLMDRLGLFRKKPGKEEYHPTFFEMLFFMGMLWFESRNAEAIVLETGMGGRLDATNVVKAPAVCVITRIGLDHMEYLGDTKEKIAAEKAGIIKPHVPVVFWDEEPAVSRVIVEKAKKMGVEVIPVSDQQVGFFNFKNKTVDFSMRSEYYEYIRVCLRTPAVYQRHNAALAVRALEVLNRVLTGKAHQTGKTGEVISRRMIEEGLLEAHWDGRMEEVLPGVVIDGAHNEDGVSAFLESVSADGCEGKRSLLFSVVSDKRGKDMAEQILKSGLFSRIAAAPMESSRSLAKEQLAALWDNRVQLYDSPEEAFLSMIRERKEKDMVYAAGSLYLAGQLLACLQEKGLYQRE